MYGINISMKNEMFMIRLKALADPTRMSIVDCLASACCGNATEIDDQGGVISPTAGEVCCTVTGASKITSTISHHLHELGSAGIIHLERRGRTTACRLVPEALCEVAEQLRLIAKGNENNEC
jgi:DNA-binding transcriptional ArsR family regulator